jgi:diguanylate cyclase (GGDEF)-like protein
MRQRIAQSLARLSLTHKVALLSLVPVLVLGVLLTRVVESELVDRSVADASQSARLIAQIGVQPRITPGELRSGLNPAAIRELDRQLQERSVTRDLARIKIWNTNDTVVYSDAHGLIGRKLPASDELENALDGRPNDAAVVTPEPNSETSAEVGLGRLVEVYVPLRFAPGTRPAGVFEIYISYAPIAKAIAHDRQLIVAVVAIGLALLWAILYRIVARASRRLRLQARENYELAHYDPLTGLPNRRLFHERVATALRRAKKRSGVVAVLLIDLDGFTQINNTLGDRTGDELLREVGSRLVARLGTHVTVARLGADEFAVLCDGERGLDGALEDAAAVQASLEAPFAHGGAAINLDASIGVAVATDESGARALLARADSALARAKAHRSRVESYSPERDDFDTEQLKLLGQVRHALDRDEFVLEYQPIVDLKSRRAVAAEALLRWHHPTRGLLMPGEFMPLIEHTTLVTPTTEYVISRALRQMVRWRERGLDLAVSVNLSARNLLDGELPGKIAMLLREHRIEADRLTVEVTESATMSDPERAVAVLRALRAGGVRIAIDDFGTGHASITYLTSLPATEIKIDRSLVVDICKDPRAEAILRSTVNLGNHLGLDVVAEGIETVDVAERLAEIGCENGQGFLFSRPIPPDQLLAWTERHAPPASSRAATGAARAVE